MKVERIGDPCEEANRKEKPIRSCELHAETDWIPQWRWLLPFCSFLAIVVYDFDAHVPSEQVDESLLGHWQDAIGNGLSRTIGGHDACALEQGPVCEQIVVRGTKLPEA